MHHPHPEKHYIHRSNWLRAAVLGANDGMLSTAALVAGVASAGGNQNEILIAGVAGLFAGSLSMATGEYVSVSSQADIEKADLEREAKGLRERPETELSELAHMFMARGVSHDTAFDVATQLSEHDALGAHAREELGISEEAAANPLEAAFASMLAFMLGAFFPLLVAYVTPISSVIPMLLIATFIGLSTLGAFGAKAGGARIWPAVFRVLFWGALAMSVTMLIGYIVGPIH